MGNTNNNPQRRLEPSSGDAEGCVHPRGVPGWAVNPLRGVAAAADPGGMDDTTEARTRRHRETLGAILFGSTALVLAVAVGAMLASGWGGGRLDNRIEPLFWAGGILTAAGVACFGVAAVPRGGDDGRGMRSVARLLGAGMALFVIGPVLSVTAVFVDYWI